MGKIETELEMLKKLTSSIKIKSENVKDMDSFFNGIECLLHVLYSCIEYEDLGYSCVEFDSEWLRVMGNYIQHLKIYESIDKYDYEE